MRKFALVAVAITAIVFSAGPLPVSAQTNNSYAVEVLGLSDQNANAEKPAEAEAASQVKSDVQTPAVPAPVIVAVQPGDSLSKIATAHDTSWVRLYDANTDISDPNVINPGDQIRVPEASEQLTAREQPKPAPVAAPSTSSAPTHTVNTVHKTYPALSSNAAKVFIYSHESGNNPNATNSNGCYGLGQDCNGRVRSLCGADYACQDSFFTNYAMSRYGSWANAQAFWLSHHWW